MDVELVTYPDNKLNGVLQTYLAHLQFRSPASNLQLAPFPGPAQLSVACGTEKGRTEKRANSDEKLGGAWEQG